MIYPDYAFGYDHRDFFSAAIAGPGRRGRSSSSRSRRPRPPSPATCRASRRETEVHLPRHGRPGGPHLRQGARRVLRRRPATREIFGFIDSLEAVDIASPGLEFLDGSHFWEGHPRYKQPGRRRVRDLLPRRRRRRRQRRLDRRRQGRLDLRPHVLHLGDALRHQGRDGGRRLPGPRRPPGRGRGDRGDDRHARRPRAPAGRQGLQRQDPPGLRPPVTSPRSRAASSPSSTPPRSRTASTPTRSTTRRCPSERLGPSAPSCCSPPSRASSWPRSSR